MADLLADLKSNRVNGGVAGASSNPGQLCLKEILADQVARPILEQAAALESVVEFDDPETVLIRYVRK